MVTKYRFEDKKGNVLADNTELPYTIGGLESGKEYPVGTFRYTALDASGNELGFTDVPSFTTLTA